MNNLPIPIFDSLRYLIDSSSEIHETRDYKISKDFLLSYRGSEATFNAYRREVERLLQWSTIIAQKTLLEINRTDIEKFLDFCQNPPKSWISVKQVSRFIETSSGRVHNPQWRPFVANITKAEFKNGVEADINQYSLSERALRELLAINSSFFNFLIQEGYRETNPISLLRQKSKFIKKYQNHQKIRRLSELQWAYVLETAETIDERTLFIMTALYAMYLRISELVASSRWIPQMRDFHQDQDGNWWFTTVGKGNKERMISVSDKMLTALKRYRMSLNLTPLPSPNDTRPLLPKQKGSGPISSTRQIRNLVQKCFDKAVTNLRDDKFNEDADKLESVTVHWLRHTGISDDVKIRPREHVRDDAGHSSSAITDKYIDIELRERHASAKKKPLSKLDD